MAYTRRRLQLEHGSALKRGWVEWTVGSGYGVSGKKGTMGSPQKNGNADVGKV